MLSDDRNLCIKQFNEEPSTCSTREEKVAANKITWKKGLTSREKSLFNTLVKIVIKTRTLPERIDMVPITSADVAAVSPEVWLKVKSALADYENLCIADAINGVSGQVINEHIANYLDKASLELWKNNVVKAYAKKWTLMQYLDRFQAILKMSYDAEIHRRDLGGMVNFKAAISYHIQTLVQPGDESLDVM